MSSDSLLILIGIGISIEAIICGILGIVIPLYSAYAKEEKVNRDKILPPHPFLGILKDFARQLLLIMKFMFILVLYFLLAYITFPYWYNCYSGLINIVMNIGIIGLVICSFLIVFVTNNLLKKIMGKKAN